MLYSIVLCEVNDLLAKDNIWNNNLSTFNSSSFYWLVMFFSDSLYNRYTHSLVFNILYFIRLSTALILCFRKAFWWIPYIKMSFILILPFHLHNKPIMISGMFSLTIKKKILIITNHLPGNIHWFPSLCFLSKEVISRL